MHQWPPAGSPDRGEPWHSFVLARNALEGGQVEEAIQLWLSIARSPDQESRHVLQAWTLLRRQGIKPGEDEAEVVHGVVCEIAVGRGHDVLAVYRDGSSRYLNHSGKVAVVDGGPPSALAAAAAVIATAVPLGHEIGLWDQEVLPDLPRGDARLLLLTPGGFRFGQGAQTALWSEPAVAALLNAATQLLQVVTNLPDHSQDQ